MTPLLRARGVTCAYRGEPAVVDVSVTVGEREFLGVVGPSGSGKTTLLRALIGTLRPVAGHLERRTGLRIGYVPQLETVDWTFPVTVGEVVLMGHRRSHRRWVPWATPGERADVARVLDQLEIGGLADRHIRDLSGGQQQRVFVARALVGGPDLLVMDEPTSGVDVRTRHEILHLLGELHAGGLAIVLSTHDLNGLAAHLPRLVCLQQRVVADGAPLDVLTPEVLERTYGAPMDVLVHGGMPVVVDTPRADVPAAPRTAAPLGAPVGSLGAGRRGRGVAPVVPSLADRRSGDGIG